MAQKLKNDPMQDQSRSREIDTLESLMEGGGSLFWSLAVYGKFCQSLRPYGECVATWKNEGFGWDEGDFVLVLVVLSTWKCSVGPSERKIRA